MCKTSMTTKVLLSYINDNLVFKLMRGHHDIFWYSWILLQYSHWSLLFHNFYIYIFPLFSEFTPLKNISLSYIMLSLCIAFLELMMPLLEVLCTCHIPAPNLAHISPACTRVCLFSNKVYIVLHALYCNKAGIWSMISCTFLNWTTLLCQCFGFKITVITPLDLIWLSKQAISLLDQCDQISYMVCAFLLFSTKFPLLDSVFLKDLHCFLIQTIL